MVVPAVRLLVSCAVLGAGVAMLLLAALGSDGYSTMISGLSVATGLAFWLVNVGVGVLLVALAWTRGLRPGPGTVVQPVVVGVVVSGLLALFEQPDALGVRVALLVLSFPVLAVGVAGYLAVDAGAGPAEAPALAFDPPLPFRWSYGAFQVAGALLGWACGAAVGPGTVLVSVLLGPLVAWLAVHVPLLGRRTTLSPAGPQVR